jgi:hypothetical protein
MTFDKGAFYETVRKRLGRLSTMQVEGIEAILAAMEGAPLAYTSYALATAWKETNKTMQPVHEAYWLSENWRRNNLRYYPHYGRGLVQITWPENYEKADKELADAGLIKRGELLANLDLAMRPDIAAFIMRKGMEEGWFSGDKKGRHTFARHLPAKGVATKAQYIQARRIINLLDDAEEIEGFAQVFERGLRDGGWE